MTEEELRAKEAELLKREDALKSQQDLINKGNQVYLDQIKELKDKTVDKTIYEKLQQDNANLVKQIAEGNYSSEDKEPPAPVDLKKLRGELFGDKELSNLEFVTKALELRNETLKQTGKDIFVASGHMVTPNEESFASAQRVADVFQDCIDKADGNAELFTGLLMARTNDIPLPIRK